MANEDDRVIRLKGSETECEFEITVRAAQLSELVRNSLDDDGDDDTDPVIDLLGRVSTDTLEKTVEFMKHYDEERMNDIPTPLGGSSFNEIVEQEWYRNFVVNMDRDMLFDVLTAANYMGIKPLLDLACLKVTFELSGKSADEIREILNLPELTPEEEANARNEHRWIFETS